MTMKSAEMKKIAGLIGKLENNLINLEIDFGQEKKHWGRIGSILKILAADTEKLGSAVRAAQLETEKSWQEEKTKGAGKKLK